jgi:hypothetical protein
MRGDIMHEPEFHENILGETDALSKNLELSDLAVESSGQDSTIDDINHLERIRDILFGEQSRDHNRRLAEIEERNFKENSHIKESLQNKIDALDSLMKKGIEEINTQIELEKKERTDAFNHFFEQYNTSHQALVVKISNIEQKISKVTVVLREEILSSSKVASDELHQKSNELLVTIEREVKILNSASSQERHNLSNYFSELSKQLREV